MANRLGIHGREQHTMPTQQEDRISWCICCRDRTHVFENLCEICLNVMERKQKSSYPYLKPKEGKGNA
jgi:hypothetical protein